MSYRGSQKGNYGKHRRRGFRGRKGFQSETNKARENFEKRSTRSQVQDLIRMAPLAPSLDVYLKSPDRYDFPNVDTPDPKLIFSHKTHRQQAADLAKLATKAPVEVWIRNTAEHDVQNVDTPIHRKRAVLPAKTHKFKVKRKAEKEELAEAEKPKEKKSKHRGRKLPTKEEILEKAKEISMIDQVKQGIEPITPEESELKETGLFEQARDELMRGEDTIISEDVLRYVDELKAELAPMGFTVTPLE